MNYFSVIRLTAVQITQPQSCVSLQGVDWNRSSVTGGFVGYTRVAYSNGTALTSCTPLGLRNAGPFLLLLRFLLRRSGDFLVWSSLSWEGGRGEVRV
ncbi:hypothetical protein AVEN_213830-1 [Araneus ventricosus]|uniref:Uncharacterized protein n=1 Tax=Araneus ventricosus TaxID=182803 RepID=A0A4Y2QEE0_ARAVE|nr:hypothetical protein AVEN_213830-1 [Araneus ventricosus]